MKAILDTHTFLWWNLNDARLSNRVVDFIADGNNDIFFSAASGWEIAIKFGKGRLELPESPDRYVSKRLTQHRFIPLPIQLSHSLHVHTLPPLHQDPFDRLLIAQSQLENMPLLTADSSISNYSLETIW